jgi:hypothetical protein
MVVMTPEAGLVSLVFGFIDWHFVRHVECRCCWILNCKFWRSWEETVTVIVYSLTLHTICLEGWKNYWHVILWFEFRSPDLLQLEYYSLWQYVFNKNVGAVLSLGLGCMALYTLETYGRVCGGNTSYHCCKNKFMGCSILLDNICSKHWCESTVLFGILSWWVNVCFLY